METLKSILRDIAEGPLIGRYSSIDIDMLFEGYKHLHVDTDLVCSASFEK